MSHNRELLTNVLTTFNGFLIKPSKFIFCSLVYLGINATSVLAEDNILVVHSHHQELSWTKQHKAGIEQGFAEVNQDSNVFHEFLDSKRHPKLEHQEEFIDYINKKYAHMSIDLLMVVDNPSLNLVLQQRDRFFSDIPVVFLGIDNLRQELFDTPWLTGVIESDTVIETAVEATRQMWTDTILIIDNSTHRRKIDLDRINRLSDRSIKVKVLKDITKQNIKSRLGKYPDHFPILVLSQLHKAQGTEVLLNPEQNIEILQKQIPNPIYTHEEVLLGLGVVGGKVLDRNYHTRQAVELANKILQGAKPNEIGPVQKGRSRWVFDYRQLTRYGIELGLLPKDSEILYIEPPFYLKYKTLVLIVVLSFLCSLLTIILLIEKIRKRAIANKILQENEQRYKDLAKAGANVFWELDRQLKYSYISGDIKDLCGLKPSEILGKSPLDLHCENDQLNIDWELFKQITEAKNPIRNFTFSMRDREHGVRIFKINGNPLYDHKQNFRGYRGVKQEITAEQNLYKKIAYQATYDDLTGLLNRREFNEKLKYCVQKAQKYNTQSVLCYLDLDRFKIVNDTAGHSVGDRLLSELAQLLQSMIRKEDTLGRLGGDEFGLLLEGCSISKGEQVCQQLISTINNYRLKWKNIEFDVGVSIGMVSIAQPFAEATDFLSRADLACYQAKNLGRGRVYIAEKNNSEIDLEQTQMGQIANVSQAIKENRFYLVKQSIKPIVDNGKQPQHYEILLRLKDRVGNVIAPEKFIPIAERYGVMTRIDRWVLEKTLDSYAKYFANQQALVFVNLSSTSINDERFTNFAIDLIQKSQVRGDCLCFEITETAEMGKVSQAKNFINAMKSLGVKFALDDFGRGISSFTYLKNLPIDYLKIDGNLVRAIADKKYERAVVNSINEIAHLMGIQTIAEFVEDDRILKSLGEISIDYAQGYITGEPVAIASS